MLGEDPAELAADLPPEMRAAMTAMSGGLGALGGLGDMMRRIGGMMVGGQAGAAIGNLAEEVVSSTDVGLPLGPDGTAALLPAGVPPSASGLEVSEDEVRLFLALREAAHQRLFAHVPWLRARLLGAVEDYARGIKVDAAALRDAMPQIDPSNPEALNEALSGAALFQPEDTPEQKAALARLETMLALVEGWVATVVGTRPQNRLPQAGALAEAIRRRRATGGPAERTFADAGRPGAAAPPAARGGRHLAGPDRGARHVRPRRGLGAPGPAAHGGRLRRPGRFRARPAGAGHLRPGDLDRRGPARYRHARTRGRARYQGQARTEEPGEGDEPGEVDGKGPAPA